MVMASQRRFLTSSWWSSNLQPHSRGGGELWWYAGGAPLEICGDCDPLSNFPCESRKNCFTKIFSFGKTATSWIRPRKETPSSSTFIISQFPSSPGVVSPTYFFQSLPPFWGCGCQIKCYHNDIKVLQWSPIWWGDCLNFWKGLKKGHRSCPSYPLWCDAKLKRTVSTRKSPTLGV